MWQQDGLLNYRRHTLCIHKVQQVWFRRSMPAEHLHSSTRLQASSSRLRFHLSLARSPDALHELSVLSKAACLSTTHRIAAEKAYRSMCTGCHRLDWGTNCQQSISTEVEAQQKALPRRLHFLIGLNRSPDAMCEVSFPNM